MESKARVTPLLTGTCTCPYVIGILVPHHRFFSPKHPVFPICTRHNSLVTKTSRQTSHEAPFPALLSPNSVNVAGRSIPSTTRYLIVCRVPVDRSTQTALVKGRRLSHLSTGDQLPYQSIWRERLTQPAHLSTTVAVWCVPVAGSVR